MLEAARRTEKEMALPVYFNVKCLVRDSCSMGSGMENTPFLLLSKMSESFKTHNQKQYAQSCEKKVANKLFHLLL